MSFARKGQEPQINNEYEVEIEINETLVWGRSVKISESNKLMFQDTEQVVLIVGY